MTNSTTETAINQVFEETCTLLKRKFNLQPTGHIDFHLEQFEAFRPYHSVAVKQCYAIKQLNCDSYLFLAEAHHKTKDGQGEIADHYEYQTWALAYVKKDFGRVKIRTETLVDKIVELVHPIELDFEEDKAFSDTFFVLIDDRDKAIHAMDRNFRNAVMDVREDGFLIEVVEHTLIIGSKKPIPAEKAVYLAEFVARLALMC